MPLFPSACLVIQGDTFKTCFDSCGCSGNGRVYFRCSTNFQEKLPNSFWLHFYYVFLGGKTTHKVQSKIHTWQVSEANAINFSSRYLNAKRSVQRSGSCNEFHPVSLLEGHGRNFKRSGVQKVGCQKKIMKIVHFILLRGGPTRTETQSVYVSRTTNMYNYLFKNFLRKNNKKLQSLTFFT